MIKVNLLSKNDNIKGFEITGHADYDKHGKDIVCAAVSILAYTCVNTIDQYSNNIGFSDDEELMKFVVDDSSSEIDVVFNTFKTGIWTLEQSYGDFVKLYTKEI